MTPIRVLLCDDQALVRSGFRMILDARLDLEVVGEAEDGLEAVERTTMLEPDVVLMDVRMPNLDGIEATRRIVSSGSAARVLILTTFDPDEYVYEAIRAGASGFLLKDVEPEELADAIRVVAAGNALLGSSVTQRLLERFAVSETTVKTHVSSVLRKLGVRDRVQAVIAAYDAGLVRPAARQE